jgi:23S rRNA (cytidine2498-2'-O)-methyltransferase
MDALTTHAYLAPEGLEPQLRAELEAAGARAVGTHGRLLMADSTAPVAAAWAQNVWLEPRRLAVTSIGDAARQLKALQRSWWPYAAGLHRRTELIQSQLPHVSAKPLAFPAPRPSSPLGSWTLLDESTILAAPRCTSPFPNGEPRFVEFKEGPPSRAYLKLFEALTLLAARPGPGERCLELGAAPGGWTWVLAGLGAEVVAYDRAPLDPAVAAMPGVTSRVGDAFAAKPGAVGAIDWLLSDVICYPERLLEHVRLWLDSGLCRNFVCTLKFQGDSHYAAIDGFAAIPGSTLTHLHHNKHELTWSLIRPANRPA